MGAVFSYVSMSNLHSSLSPPERQSLCLALFFANGRSLISLSVMRLKNGAVHIEINWEEEETLLYILACDDQSSVATTWDTAGEQHSLCSQVLESQSHCMPRKGHIVGMGHRAKGAGTTRQVGSQEYKDHGKCLYWGQEHTSKRCKEISLVCLNITRSRGGGTGR